MSESIFLILFLGFIILLPFAIFLLAYLAAQSRKNKQKKLLQEVPSDTLFSACVRYNRDGTQDKLIKLKAFEGSGIIYIQENHFTFKSTKGLTHTFDFKNTKIIWEGENLINGLLKWFSVNDGQLKLYLNMETGMFIFQTGNSKETTQSIYNNLMLHQMDKV